MSSSASDARLLELCLAAARGSFPPADWQVEFLAAPSNVAAAVVAFTSNHVVAADIDPAEIEAQFDANDIAAPSNPTFLAWLGQRIGARVGHIDVALARFGTGAGDRWLVPTNAPPHIERVERARALRADVEFFTTPDTVAIVALGRGLGGRRELSMEVTVEAERGHGIGRRIVEAALDRVPADELLFATVAPGNTRSLRCLLAAGFVAIGAECLFSRTEPSR